MNKEELKWAKEYFSASNYLSAASLYLRENFLLKNSLKFEHIKENLVGHWGTCPGINFIYTHLNFFSFKNKQKLLLVVGPGHGFAAILANQYLDGSLRKYHAQFSNDEKGISSLLKSFSWPSSGFPSHVNPGVPGMINEGGELGYSLGVAFGAVLDDPELVSIAIVGDGEAETGAIAAAWHSNKFVNPRKDGAVLPILHLNGYKLGNPSIYGTMSDIELNEYFTGLGYEVLFAEAEHESMQRALEKSFRIIKKIQQESKEKSIERPKWPMIIFKSLKGWTGVKEFKGKKIEGSYRSHQIPLKEAKTDVYSLKILEKWLKSYKPEKIIKQGKLNESLLSFVPLDAPIGDCDKALGGNFRKELFLPDIKEETLKFKERGKLFAGSTEVLGNYLKKVIILNDKNSNFRIFSPDELASNRLEKVFEATNKMYFWPHSKDDEFISQDGKIMEVLNEQLLQSWMQGYILTGKHGILASYESFLPILDSMVSQYLKFIESSREFTWRKQVSSFNYLSSSTCWRQDHNGFSHQNPGFISNLLNKAKEEHLVRFYFPADANMMLATISDVLRSTNRVNLITSDKQMIRQWQSYEEASEQFKVGAGIWKFASNENPEVILAACGDYQTQEMLATISMLKKEIPELKLRFVNVSELNVLGKEGFYPNALDERKFRELFTEDKHVIFSYHGYPSNVKQLLFDRPNTLRFHVYGYIERGTTTTPFDMLIRNKLSRYHIAIRAIQHSAITNPKTARKAKELIAKYKRKIEEHREYILKNGKDPEEINGWTWKDSKK